MSDADAQALTAEHAAPRRVATLAGRAVSNRRLFAAVCQKLARLVGADAAAVLRFDPDETITLLAGRNAAGDPVSVGEQQPVNAALRRLRDSGRHIRCGPADVPLTGPFIAEIRRLGIRAVVAVPIQVDRWVWGVIVAASRSPEPFPAATEAQMVDFAELAATAISIAQSHAELAGSRARVIAAADETRRKIHGDLHDGCLPRLRACEIPAGWGAVAASTDQVRSEVKQLAGVLLGDVERIAECSVARMQELLPSYAKVPAEKLIPVTLTNTRNLLEVVRDPGANPTRGEDQFRVSGETRVSQGIAADEMLQAWRIGLEVVREEAHPVASQLGIADDALLDFVEATLQWGDVGMRKSASAYRETEIRELQRLAAEKDAVRRVATLVARGTLPRELFAAVVDEVGELLPVELASMCRYESDGFLTVVASWGKGVEPFAVGSRQRLGGTNLGTIVFETGRPARLDRYADTASGPLGAGVKEAGIRSSVATPIAVEGRVWGVIVAGSVLEQPLPADTESRLMQFTELVGTAIANAESRAALAASRARIVAAADQSRRRLERDLHDGAQQRLVHAVIVLKLAQTAVSNGDANAGELVAEALRHAEDATLELRELAHGILPVALRRGGLQAGVETLVSRVSLPVSVDVAVERLPAAVEATAYFVVSEALTNVVKHARAAGAEVRARVEQGQLQVEVRDDGVGGARGDHITGLGGLEDRVSALGGRLVLQSPRGGGTHVCALLPVSGQG